MDEVREVSVWNKKRIFAGVVLIVFLAAGIYFVKTKILGENSNLVENNKSVKGVVAKEEEKIIPDFNLQEAVKNKINSIKQEVSGLNIVEIASSSPQVQKVLNDIKALEQYPTNQAREICKQICSF
ncbi:MAG: hypothetical protein Q7R51_00315 [bacterium]|nr:hypothetical protein [bacterium]